METIAAQIYIHVDCSLKAYSPASVAPRAVCYTVKLRTFNLMKMSVVAMNSQYSTSGLSVNMATCNYITLLF